MRQGPHVQFRNAALEPELRSRGDAPGQIAARDLTRYYVLLNHARGNVHELFADPAEWALMRDALSSAPGIDYQPNLFAVSVADSIQLDHAAERYGVDGTDLLARVQALSPLQTVALLDTIERWWVMRTRDDATI